MHGHVQQYMLLLIYGGSNPSRNASCKMTKTFSWQKSLVTKWPTFSWVVWLICVSFIFQTKPSFCFHLHSLVSVYWIQYNVHETVLLSSSFLILPLLLVVVTVVTVVVLLWLRECWTLNHYCAIVCFFFSGMSDKATKDGFITASRKQSGNSGMDVPVVISDVTEKHRMPVIGVRSSSSLSVISERVKTIAHFVWQYFYYVVTSNDIDSCLKE